MNYIKLFESYYGKLFNLIEKYHYEEITDGEFSEAASKFCKNKENWSKKELNISKELINLSKCKISKEGESKLTMPDISHEIFLLDNKRQLNFEFIIKWVDNFHGSTIIVQSNFEIAKHKHNYYYLGLKYNSQTHTNGNVHSIENTNLFYRCDEFEGFLKCLKMMVQKVTDLE